MTVTKRMAICGKQSNSLKRKKKMLFLLHSKEYAKVDRKFVRIVAASKESSREL